MAAEFIEELPVKSSGQFDWVDIADALVANPGKWAKISLRDGREMSENTAMYAARTLRQNDVDALKKEHVFEATARGTVVYGKYVGKANST